MDRSPALVPLAKPSAFEGSGVSRKKKLKKKKKWLPLRDHPFAAHSGISSFKIVRKGDYHEAGIHELVDNLFSNLENSNGGGCRSQLRPHESEQYRSHFPKQQSRRGPGSHKLVATRRCITLTVASVVGGDKRHSQFQ